MPSIVRRVSSLACLASLLAAPTLLVGCGGGDGGDDASTQGAGGAAPTSAAPLAFHFSQDALPGFKYDTGLLPANQPVQLQLTVSASGTSSVDAEGYAVAADKLQGRQKSGHVKIDGGFSLVGRLKVDISTLQYDGDLPGLKGVNIAFEGDAPFEPFSLGKEVLTTAAVPAIDLPPIPLPGGLPGTLNLKIAEGSSIALGFTGTCAGVDGGKASYHGTVRRGGTVKLESKVVLKIPLVGDKEFSFPVLTLPIDGLVSPIDLGSPAATPGTAPADAGEVSAVSCTGAGGSGGSSGAGGKSAGGSAGSGPAGGAAGIGGSGGTTGGAGGSAGAAGGAAGTGGSAGSGAGGMSAGGSAGSGGGAAGQGGAGGSAAGSGGAVAGSGGAVAGSGGAVAGSGGSTAGSGGAAAGAGGAKAGAGGAAAGSGGTSGAGGVPATCKDGGPEYTGANACQDCQGTEASPGGCCDALWVTCSANAECTTLLDCVNPCGDQPCVDACYASHPNGLTDFTNVSLCLLGASGAGSPGACGHACSVSTNSCVDGGTSYGTPGTDTCTTCQQTEFQNGGCCGSEASACVPGSPCDKINVCVNGCGADPACAQACADATPGGVADYNSLAGCLFGDGTPGAVGACLTVCQ